MDSQHWFRKGKRVLVAKLETSHLLAMLKKASEDAKYRFNLGKTRELLAIQALESRPISEPEVFSLLRYQRNLDAQIPYVPPEPRHPTYIGV